MNILVLERDLAGEERTLGRDILVWGVIQWEWPGLGSFARDVGVLTDWIGGGKFSL